MFWPCETRTSTCRSFATISSGLYRFLAIAVLLDVKDIPQVGPLQWGWIKLVDVHNWNYPEADFDVVVEIFTQFSSPAERALKWSGMKRSLKSGGLLIIQGYTPKQLEYGTGGPKQIENLYTRAILERAFAEFRLLSIVEEEREIHEGTSHGGMSAVINLTATKP